MLITLLHPSRSRPQKAFETARRWFDSGGIGVKWEYILSCDSSDPSLKEYDPCLGTQNLRRIVNDNKSVVDATNQAARVSNGDILLYLSDDFSAPDNWGQLIINEFKKYSGPTLIKVHDCLQGFDVPVLTIPIMNRALYERLGYFFHPEYKSMFVDCHLYEIVKKNGWLKFAPHLEFPHEHVSIGKAEDDETYRRSAANWEQGKALFAKHKSQGFPL